jgi:hypothetical protein
LIRKQEKGGWKEVEYNPEKFKPDKWEPMPRKEKIEALQGLENQNAKEQGRESRRVKDAGIKNSFYDRKKGVLKINRELLRSPEEAVNEVGHEGEHAFQRDAAEGKLSQDALQKAYEKYGGEGAFEEKVKAWQINFKEGAYFKAEKTPKPIYYKDENGNKQEFNAANLRYEGYAYGSEGGYEGGLLYHAQPVEMDAKATGLSLVKRVRDDLNKLKDEGKSVDTSGFDKHIENAVKIMKSVDRDATKVFKDYEQKMVELLKDRVEISRADKKTVKQIMRLQKSKDKIRTQLTKPKLTPERTQKLKQRLERKTQQHADKWDEVINSPRKDEIISKIQQAQIKELNKQQARDKTRDHDRTRE